MRMLYDYSPAEYQALADVLNEALVQQAEELVNSISPLALMDGRPQHYKNRARLTAASRLAKVNVLFLRGADEAFSMNVPAEDRVIVHRLIIKLAGIFHSQALDCLSFDGRSLQEGDDRRHLALEQRYTRLRMAQAVSNARSEYERRTKGAKLHMQSYRLVDRLLERAANMSLHSF